MTERLSPAERLLIRLGVKSPSDIDLEAIAWTMGAVVNYRKLDRCEATIVGSQRRAIITINSNAIPTRQRFSVAHEIGHWHLHRGRILFCGNRDIDNPGNSPLNPETQADHFASDLLLPTYLFKPLIAKFKRPTLAMLREIAAEFSASDTATLLKLVGSNQFPILAVCHSKDRRRWFQRAPMIPGWWFPRDQLDPDTFAFDLLFKGATEATHPRKVGADAWFEFRGVDRFEVREQSFLLPGNEVLTLLILPDSAIS